LPRGRNYNRIIIEPYGQIVYLAMEWQFPGYGNNSIGCRIINFASQMSPPTRSRKKARSHSAVGKQGHRAGHPCFGHGCCSGETVGLPDQKLPWSSRGWQARGPCSAAHYQHSAVEQFYQMMLTDGRYSYRQQGKCTAAGHRLCALKA